MNRLFSTLFDTPTTRANGNAAMGRWIPAMDLVDTGEHFVLKADLPGMAESDVKVEVATFDNGVLEVRIPKPVQSKPRRVQIGVGGGEPRTIESEAAAAGEAGGA